MRSYGRLNTCKKILSAAEGQYLINLFDGRGLTPLHHACMQGNLKIVQLLLARGALFHRWAHTQRTLVQVHIPRTSTYRATRSSALRRGFCGSTPLHLAALTGQSKVVKHLLDVAAHLLNSSNNIGVRNETSRLSSPFHSSPDTSSTRSRNLC